VRTKSARRYLIARRTSAGWMRSYMIVRKVRKELQSRGETREFEGVTSVCTSVSPAPTGFSNFVEKIRRTLFHMRAKSARCEGRSK
jgi:hypothetical protein